MYILEKYRGDYIQTVYVSKTKKRLVEYLKENNFIYSKMWSSYFSKESAYRYVIEEVEELK